MSAMGITGCQQSEIECFDPQYAALNMWFGTEGGIIDDEEVFNYSYAVGEAPVNFYARISGVPADHDRTFTLQAEGADLALAEGSVRTETYTIPAGKTTGTFAIYLDASKLKDPNSFTEKEGEITFRMVEGGEFRAGAEKVNVLRLKLRNYLSKPAEWEKGANGLYRPLREYFGDYSKVKHSFMIQTLGMVEFRIYWNAQKPYEVVNGENIISRGYASYLVQKMQEALKEYNASHEKPLTDEFGNAVTF